MRRNGGHAVIYRLSQVSGAFGKKLLYHKVPAHLLVHLPAHLRAHLRAHLPVLGGVTKLMPGNQLKFTPLVQL